MNVNDKISMEYEARVMISESDYRKIYDRFLNSGGICRVFTNKNTYLDTPDLYLTHHHAVLRIREIDDIEKELTLKIKGEKGDIEITHQIKDEQEYQELLKGKITDKEIIKEIELRGGNVSTLKVVATLITERMEVPFFTHLLVIDKNYYNDKIDYNLEVESTSRIEADKYLKVLTSEYNIEYKEDYISKSRRAILKL